MKTSSIIIAVIAGAMASSSIVTAIPQPMPMPHPNCLADVIHSHGLERRHLMRRNNNKQFSYEGDTGPEHWGEFNITCQTGNRQSPVDFDSDSYLAQPYGVKPDLSAWPKKLLGPIDYININGHTVQVNIPEDKKKEFATKQINGKVYYLQQFHFHVPSEHHVKGAFYPGEIHFVHASEDKALSVVGFFLKYSFDSDEFFSQLLEEPPAQNSPPKKLFNLNFEPLIKAAESAKAFYTYEGSLTVPPCTEGIFWTVSKTPVPVNFAQLQLLQDELGFTARPTQNNSFIADKKAGK
ncbi:hypothetical protein HDU96_007094 [Phlyctochytrium bullatum]|nr:hypothetical protein HDU96_007094 [Phlyctochytrium bullatum]